MGESVTATIGANVSPFKRGLDEIRGDAQRFAGDIKSMMAGAFATGAVVSFLSNMRSEIARSVDLGQRFGETAETIQKVGNVAKLAGTDIETVARVMSGLTLEAAKNAAAFTAAGISADAFMSASMEDQVLMLAQAFESANGNQNKTIALMDLLGRKGQEIIPLLKTGFKELSEQISNVPVVAESAAQAIAALDDGMDSVVMTTKAWLGWLVQAWQTIVAVSVASVSGGSLKDRQEAFRMQYNEIWNPEKPKKGKGNFDREAFEQAMGAQEDSRKAIEKAQSDQQKAEEKLGEIKRKIALDALTADERLKALQLERSQATEAFGKTEFKTRADQIEAVTKIYQIEEQIAAQKRKVAEDQKKAAEEQKRASENSLQAQQSLAAELEKMRLSGLSAQQRAAELQAKQTALQKEADATSDPKRSAEIKAESLKLSPEIEAARQEAEQARLDAMTAAQRETELRKQQRELFAQSEAAKKGGDQGKLNELRVQALKLNPEIDSASEQALRTRLAKLTPEQQKIELRRRVVDLSQQAKEAQTRGDIDRAAQLTTEARKITDDLRKDDRGGKRSIVSSTLAAIGGGGGAYVSGTDPALNESRRQTQLLQQLVDVTRGKDATVSTPFKAPKPF